MKKIIVILIAVILIISIALISIFSFTRNKPDNTDEESEDEYYSIADEDSMAPYASLKDKAAFEAALKALVIEDSEYAKDEAEIESAAWETLYNDFAFACVRQGVRQITGTPSANAVVFYNYYYTYTDSNNTVYYFNDNMRSDKSVSVTLGLKDLTDFEKQLKDVITATKIDDYVYSTRTTGVARENDVAYVSYTLEKNVEIDGVNKQVRYTVVNERIELKRGTSAFVDYLIDKNVGTHISDFSDAGLGETYKNIKIAFVSGGNEICAVKEVTYTEEKKVRDIYGVEHNLKDQELTYHIYPVNYVDVPEFTAENLLNFVFGKDITYDAVEQILFGKSFSKKSEEEKNAILINYTANHLTGSNVTLKDLVESLKTFHAEYEAALNMYYKAKADEDTKRALAMTAEAKLAAANPDDANYNDLQKALDTARFDLQVAEQASMAAEKRFEEMENGRNDSVNLLVQITNANANAGVGYNLIDGYFELACEYLLDRYNEDIRAKLSEEISKLFDEHVEIKKLPEKALESAENEIVDGYKRSFNSDMDPDTGNSYYSDFNGKFKEFLKQKLNASSYEEAMSIIAQEAEDEVKEAVIIYTLSEIYEVLASDKEFEEYVGSDMMTQISVTWYGENYVRYQYQSEKLTDYLLSYEKDADGKYVYLYVAYTIVDKK